MTLGTRKQAIMTKPNDSKAQDADRSAHTGRTSEPPAQSTVKRFCEAEAERDEPEGPNDGPALARRERE